MTILPCRINAKISPCVSEADFKVYWGNEACKLLLSNQITNNNNFEPEGFAKRMKSFSY
jgi:hypothetical protein